jgi:diaminopimelate epimerase
MRFTKLQGCGNDYIYVDCFRTSIASATRRRATPRG